jgi:transglutaminase-like putative cysteine protease
MKSLVVLSILLGLGASAFAQESTKLDPQQPYSAERSNPVTYDVEFQAIVTAPYKTKKLRVWMPIPPTDIAQELISSELSTFPEEVRPQIADEPVFGNRFAYFEFANPQGGQIIRHKFKIRAWELRWGIDRSRVQAVSEWPETFAPYQRRESQAVVADARFEKLLAQILPQRRGPLHDLETVLSWVDRNLEYDHVKASLKASSVHALEQRRGHCSDYHGFCAAMGRLMGQPTRVTYGLNAFPKNSPSHCKLEAFLPPYGWVSFDVSETQKQTQAIRSKKELSDAERDDLQSAARRRLLSGFRDNTWFLQTRGTDYDLVPKAAARAAVVRTIYAEADGKALADPDPANTEQTTYAWMTAHRFQADKTVKYPFTELGSLREWIEGAAVKPTGARP